MTLQEVDGPKCR